MRKSEQVAHLRELARQFEIDPDMAFTCNEIRDYALEKKYTETFELGERYDWNSVSENVKELWTEMTPQDRQNQRVMMLCFMAAIVEAG